MLPEKIYKLIADEAYKADNIGMSGSSVLVFEDKVLKVQEYGKAGENEYRMMRWLQNKLPVPQVLAYEVAAHKSYLLMSKCSGKMACDQEYMCSPTVQAKMLSEGLKKLWQVDIADCPGDWSLRNKLAAARDQVENGLVDMDHVEPDTFGENGFKSPEDLLQWLCDHRPGEELVLSHGDYCLPNIFGEGNAVSGYIDLGRTGIADKWCDIALCYRSLSHNYGGRYSGQSYPDYDDMLLFRELEIEPDWEKIRYYTLLDELF